MNERIQALWGKDEPATVVEALARHASERPNAVAYEAIADRDDRNSVVTYLDLDRRARRIAGTLLDSGARGRPVILLFPPGLDYVSAFLGCLYAGAIAVPAYPPDPQRMTRTLPRLQAILGDSGALLAVTTDAYREAIDASRPEIPALKGIAVLSIDALPEGREGGGSLDLPAPDALALLQYTSGSTAAPKGVMVSHANLLVNVRSTYIRLEHDSESRFVSWLPPYHDMGLIGGILQPLYGGFASSLMPPLAFLRRPLRWLETLSRVGATTTVAPNFAYDLCVRRVAPEERRRLDLSRWRLAMSGSEPVRADTMDAFATYFAPCGFRREAFFPCYGLAEATLMVSGGGTRPRPYVRHLSASSLERGRAVDAAAGPERSTGVVGCGQASDCTIAIVEPEGARMLPDGVVGEIWVTGETVARGYWGKSSESKRTFRARIDGDDRDYLRTGDLGFMDDGELFVTGRIKDLIIVHGRNVYPQDLEAVAEKASPAVRPGCCASFAIELEGSEHVVLVCEVESRSRVDGPDVVARIRQAVAEQFDLALFAVLLVRTGAIPRTTSGKIQRRATKRALLDLDLPCAAVSVSADAAIAPERRRFGSTDALREWLEGARVAARSPAAPSNDGVAGADARSTFVELVTIAGRVEAELGVAFPWPEAMAAPEPAALLEALARDLVRGEPTGGPSRENEGPTALAGAAADREGRVAEIRRWMIAEIARATGVRDDDIDPNVPFTALGIDSGRAVELTRRLGRFVGVPIPDTLVWDQPCVSSSAAFVASQAEQVVKGRDHQVPHEDAIAIVGIGCRFPGAADCDAFWRLLRDGRDAVGEVPPSRWVIDEPAGSDRGAQGAASRWGAFLDRIDGFDAAFFGISAREADRMDPQQRLLLEVSWEALEHAGISPQRLGGTRAGVFIGISSTDYVALQFADPQNIDAHVCTGNAHSVAANRISYALDLRGPSVAIDTACSSSLVAVHLACESLRRAESSVALAGGVNLMITPDLTIGFSRARMLALDGRCKTFDERADGYVRGEGCGVVVLKRASDAIAEGDPILAVILGSAVSHDGRSNGLTAPSRHAQVAAIREALRTARVEPESVGFVEAHGTGTALGDPIEFEAIAEALGGQRTRASSCWVGSVKTNIGHLEAAAGIAGLVKAVLAVRHGEVPAHLHFRTPNPRLRMSESGLQIPTRTVPWSALQTRRVAGVSAFGFGGTNAHVIVAQAPPVPEHAPSARRAFPLCLSARTPSALGVLRRRYASYLESHPNEAFADVCATSAAGRAHFEHRFVVVGATGAEVLAHLRASGDDAAIQGVVRRGSCPRIGFLFTGQGAQYLAMAPRLYECEPVFRARIDACDAVLAGRLERTIAGWITGEAVGAASELEDTRIQQPVLYALEIALADLWRSWGVVPDAVAGHSLGEYAAACVAGVVSWQDGLRLVAERARLMAAQPQLGTMVACIGDEACIRDAVARHGAGAQLKSRLAIAARNAPDTLVVSGTFHALEAFTRDLEARGVVVKPLRVSHAFHSPLMDGAVKAFEREARSVAYHPPRIALLSNVTGRPMPTDAAPDATYWTRHLRETVHFEGCLRGMRELGCDALIEIGPGSTLLGLARKTLAPDEPLLLLPSLQRDRDDHRILMEALGRLYVAGATVDWAAVLDARSRKRVALPSYPFERATHWLDTRPKRRQRAGADAHVAVDPSENAIGAVEATRSATDDAGHSLDVRTKVAIVDSGAAALISTPQAAGGCQDVVFAHLSAVCGFAPRQIAVDARLGADLGFDSLMKIELNRRLLLAFPRLGQLPAGVLPDDPTVRELLTIVEGGKGAHAATVEASAISTPFAPAMRSHSLDREAVSRENGQPHHGQNGVSLSAGPNEHAVRRGSNGAGAGSTVSNAAPIASHTQEHEDPVRDVSAAARGVARQARLQDFEEYRALEDRLRTIESVGANPYGRVHESRNSGRAIVGGRRVVNFASFNYLALSAEREVCEAAKAAIERYGTSTSATPLLFGETPLHHELEREIAGLLGTEAALAFSSGHATAVAMVSHLLGPQDLIVHDQLIHDSTVRGAMMCGATRRPFRHNDFDDLDRILGAMRGRYRRALIVLEGVYSQDGDLPDLPRAIDIKKRYDALLMIDEAHSIGVLGATGGGVGEHFRVPRRDVDLWMGTLSKALGSCGGYVAGTADLVRFLKFTTPLFIFSTGISPANAGAATAAIQLVRRDPKRVARLQDLSRQFLGHARELGLDTGSAGESAIVPVIVGEWDRALRVSNALLERDINVMPIGYPAVDRHACRLRFFVNADHEPQDLRRALEAAAEEIHRGSGRSALAPERDVAEPITPSERANVSRTAPSGRVDPGHRGPTSVASSARADVLVTGASGFIGGHLARALVARGHRVRVVLRPRSVRRHLEGLPLEIVEGALEDVPSARAAVDGVRVIYNCAGLSTDWAPWAMFHAANVRGVETLLAAAEADGSLRRFVHLSTSDVYGYPFRACDETAPPRDVGLPYNRSKVLGEQVVWRFHESVGIPVTVVRPVTVYGPRSKDWVVELVRLLRSKQLVLFDRGSTVAGLLFVDNAVNGILAAAEATTAVGQAYNLRDQGDETWREYVDAIAQGLGLSSVKTSLPSKIALAVARASEAAYGGLGVRARPIVTRHSVLLMSRDQGYPVQKASRDLGFESSASFGEGLARTLAWLKSDEGMAAVAS